VQSAALHFFLGSEDENSEDSEAEEEDVAFCMAFVNYELTDSLSDRRQGVPASQHHQ
jgi:hypothetical protein